MTELRSDNGGGGEVSVRGECEGGRRGQFIRTEVERLDWHHNTSD